MTAIQEFVVEFLLLLVLAAILALVAPWQVTLGVFALWLVVTVWLLRRFVSQYLEDRAGDRPWLVRLATIMFVMAWPIGIPLELWRKSRD